MNFIAWTPFFVVFALFIAWTLWHLARHDSPYMPKWAWALLIVFAMPVGTLIYLLVAGPKKTPAVPREVAQEPVAV